MSSVLIVGGGDLGTRLSLRLAAAPALTEVVVATRRPELASLRASSAPASLRTRIQIERLDIQSQRDVERFLPRRRFDLIVHAATRLSPWHFVARSDFVGATIRRAGFGIQLCAQLPLITSVMLAIRERGIDSPVINYSYPDVTNPVLAKRGLAPTAGAGNVSMIAARVAAARYGEAETHLLRVIAHHSHVAGSMSGQMPKDFKSRPQIYLGEAPHRNDALAYAGPPLPSDHRLNEFTALSTVPILLAFLTDVPQRCCVPGPLGLPGGYPTRISNHELALDLPAGLTCAAAAAFNEEAARDDGVEKIDDEGTVFFTETTRKAIATLAPELGEPLEAKVVDERCRRLLTLATA
jgi:hypothetical protein